MSSRSVMQTLRQDTYEAISPTRPELSAAGKTVIITGAGSGIGRETAFAFANAGARYIALLGRREYALRETADALAALSPQTTITVHSVNICDDQALSHIAVSIGTWDMLVHAAGPFSPPQPIVTTKMSNYWEAFEVNTKGTFVVLQSFAKTANSHDASLCTIISASAALPAAYVPTFSSYMASKLAQAKIVEHFAAENPHITAVNVHPGFVDTANLRSTGFNPADVPTVKIQLPAHFIVWLSSPQAKFLSGRCVSATWDVNEIMTKEDGLSQSSDWIVGINQFPQFM